MTDEPTIPARFLPAYRQIERLQRHQRYLGAFVFGSVARGDATERSDLDVKVVVAEDNPCANINHPVIGGVKLDITCHSPAQLREATAREIAEGKRVPMVAESLIVFDRTGELRALRDEARRAHPQPVTPADHQLLQFLVYHADDKARRALDEDTATAIFVLETGLLDLLAIHYRLRGRWWLSTKRLLGDLRGWDPALAALVESFVSAGAPPAKFAAWSAIVDHVLRPLGGRRPIAENTCACAVCRQDLARLLSSVPPARMTRMRRQGRSVRRAR